MRLEVAAQLVGHFPDEGNLVAEPLRLTTHTLPVSWTFPRTYRHRPAQLRHCYHLIAHLSWQAGVVGGGLSTHMGAWSGLFGGTVSRGMAAAASAAALAVGAAGGATVIGGSSPDTTPQTLVMTRTVVATATVTKSPKPKPTVKPSPTRSSAKATPSFTVEKVPTSKSTTASPTCDPNYARFCVPIVSYDLNCADIRARVRVVGNDIHGFDNGGEPNVGCESYRWRD